MKWREVGGRQEQEPKPSLTAVLDHYEADYAAGRSSQMIHCVFHEDNTPSMSISLSDGVWNCHSCGRGGDSYELIKEKEEVDFAGAREFATTLGIADGDAGGSNERVRVSSITGRRSVPVRQGDRRASGSYVPTWRRR